MYYQEFYYWCRDAVSKIKYTPDRNKVYTELYTHLEDRYESFLSKGLSEKESEEKTLAAMGDPKELAPQLAAIHKPFWGYALSFIRVIAVIVLVITIGSGIYYLVDQQPWYTDTLRDWGEPQGMETLVYSGVSDAKDRMDGYTFRVTNVAVWRATLDEPIGGKDYLDYLYLRLEVRKPVPWAMGQEALGAMWAVDSTGTYYDRVMRESTEPDGIKYMGIIQRQGDKIYDLYFSSVSEDLEWIELHYDRDGRNLVLRVELTGGVQR